MWKMFRKPPAPPPSAPGSGIKASQADPGASAALLDEVRHRRQDLEARVSVLEARMNALDERLTVITRGQYEP